MIKNGKYFHININKNKVKILKLEEKTLLKDNKKNPAMFFFFNFCFHFRIFQLLLKTLSLEYYVAHLEP